MTLLLAAIMLLSMTACGGGDTGAAEEIAASPTPTVTEEPQYEGKPEYYFDTFYDLASNPCTLEVVDEETIRANIYQQVMYRADFVEQATVGDNGM